MQLIGRNLSPVIRHTTVVLKLWDLPFEQVRLSTADDAGNIGKINPVVRVPSMALDDGKSLISSKAMIDQLLETCYPDNSLMPSHGAERGAVLYPATVGHCDMEKAVASSYERNRPSKAKVFGDWVKMLEDQVVGGLTALNKTASKRDYLHGDHLTMADDNAVVAHNFVGIAVRYLLKEDLFPTLAALAERCCTMPAFADTAIKPS